jgi:hypothetical protein
MQEPSQVREGSSRSVSRVSIPKPGAVIVTIFLNSTIGDCHKGSLAIGCKTNPRSKKLLGGISLPDDHISAVGHNIELNVTNIIDFHELGWHG